jgi:hypothetical protein
MDQKKARNLKQELVKAIVEIVCRLGLRRLPLLPSHKTMEEMARAAVAVYEAEVDRPKEQTPSEPGETDGIR